MTPDEQQQQLKVLQQQVNQNQTILFQHRHTGSDYTQQLSSDTSSSGGTVYAGEVQNTGTPGSVFPAGWSCAITGPATFTITHNLGTNKYVVVATLTGTPGFLYIPWSGFGSNSFFVNTTNTSNSPATIGFYFAVYT